MMIEQFVLRGIQPTLGTRMYAPMTSFLVLLLGAFLFIGHLALGNETLVSDGCITCDLGPDRSASTFTLRNALPLDDFNAHMTCSYFDECGMFYVQPVIDLLPCNSINMPAAPYSSPGAWEKIEQVLCEFVWTRTTLEVYQRALVLVWSRNLGAPNNTFYKIDKDGFWFSTARDGTLTKIGTWSATNPLSSEPSVLGSGLGVYKIFGHSQCHQSPFTSHSK